MKHLQTAVIVAAAIVGAALLLSPRLAQAQEPAAVPCHQAGVCAYLRDYLCCRQPYCGKPAPCPPCFHLGCGVPYCPKPAPCPPCFPLQWCPDCYVGKPAPCCIPKPPCPPLCP